MFDDEETCDHDTGPRSDRYSQLLSEAETITVPFDMVRYADENPFIFDFRETDGPEVGKFARFKGGYVSLLRGEQVLVQESVGEIVMHRHGRVVIAFDNSESDFIYVGWLNPDDYEIIENYFVPESQKWMH